MASNNFKQRPFNLLYKYDTQKTGIDRLYDFVTVQGRIIVVSVMLLIILAFIYRFPLDKRLNDEVNDSKQNIELLKIFVDNNEKNFNDIVTRISKTKNYTELYSSNSSNIDEVGRVRFAEVFKKINAIESEFGENITLVSHNLNTDESLKSKIQIKGFTTQFSIAEEFREKLRLEKGLIDDVLISNLGSSKEGIPQFSLSIKIKEKK